MERVSKPDTSPLIMACKRCGHREWSETQIPPPWPAKDTEYVRIVVEITDDDKKVQQIRALRQLDQQLAGLPADKAIKTLASNKTIDLGIHRLDAARQLLEKASALNLKARLAGPEEDLPDDQVGRKLIEPFGAPVSVGKPGEEAAVIPFLRIVIGVILIGAVVAWIMWG